MEKAYYYLGKETEVFFPKNFETGVLSALWRGFCFQQGEMKAKFSDREQIVIGEFCPTELIEGDEYSVNITSGGITVLSRDRKSLIRGFLTLMQNIEQTERGQNKIECRLIRGNFSVKTRMIHLCVFPETTFLFLKKAMYLSAVFQYTHIIVEFWGMLKYDFTPILSWDTAFTKSEIDGLFSEIRAMGVEIVPNFNHVGHASGCRAISGKHVVLDRYPEYAYMFTPEGWAWNIRSADAKSLLKNVRSEMCELYGKGKYFFIGGDEAYIYGDEYLPKEEFAAYFKYVTEEVEREDRIPIVWHDMMFSKEESESCGEGYISTGRSSEAAQLLRGSIAKGTIIADWEYEAKKAPVMSAHFFQKEGFDVLLCPYNNIKNIPACVETASENGILGIIQTTWHTLDLDFWEILYTAHLCGLPLTTWAKLFDYYMETATVMRKIIPFSTYSNSGFVDKQIGGRF